MIVLKPDEEEVMMSEDSGNERRDFYDGVTGAWARITETHLVQTPDEQDPREYPLDSIQSVRSFDLGTLACVIVYSVAGLAESPGFIFADKHLADEFMTALLDAIEEAANESRSPLP